MLVLTKQQLNKIGGVFKEFTEATKWRRDLTWAEKRVNFEELQSNFDNAEKSFVEDVAVIMKQVILKLTKEVEDILDGGDFLDYTIS